MPLQHRRERAGPGRGVWEAWRLFGMCHSVKAGIGEEARRRIVDAAEAVL